MQEVVYEIVQMRELQDALKKNLTTASGVMRASGEMSEEEVGRDMHPAYLGTG